jgi:hypothetical protein
MLAYIGNHELVNNVDRPKVIFHAKKAIQKLNFDNKGEQKALEMTVDETLRFILPSDFVKFVRISLEKDGILYPLLENTQIMSSLSFAYDENMHILFDEDGNCVSPEYSNLDYKRIFNSVMGFYDNPYSRFNGRYGYCYEGHWYFDRIYGKRFYLDTEHANSRPKFTIDSRHGVINFFSDMQNELAVLEYMSDGMENGDDSKIRANKLYEDFIYAYISAEILDNKLGVQEYIINRKNKKSSSLLRNAKLRTTDFSGLLMALRGQDKILK